MVWDSRDRSLRELFRTVVPCGVPSLSVPGFSAGGKEEMLVLGQGQGHGISTTEVM